MTLKKESIIMVVRKKTIESRRHMLWISDLKKENIYRKNQIRNILDLENI